MIREHIALICGPAAAVGAANLRRDGVRYVFEHGAVVTVAPDNGSGVPSKTHRARATASVNLAGYLVHKSKAKQKSHIWRGNDTACRMWSTNGLHRENYVICDTPGGHEICQMCTVVAERAAA